MITTIMSKLAITALTGITLLGGSAAAIMNGWRRP